ncbi:putative trans-sialidase, Group V [Trypanosoma cruzi]|uniref:Trans-sialidase, putative n=2 Tax=Trypanosoma cruzi TaxID=5693 RepID=Q4E2C0_TRYCC|nr:trans-sialidase, putative [Trypanosoma cruzi]EAN98906.1 trans-sialidase, putative [Trypanosoma cruzi]PWV17676.1 putative trans-sialidase, Group V [Trypanosoma cruzi]|eukprot:XP_820757.1 trans-sialidase [Trypanosoma cruzi strain CL Brener]
MLSRVAAVKAPRTHNRRRVTGSSGGRREGRESEPQRPNMSRHLFYSAVLLLLVVMMCCGTGGAASSKDVPSAPGSSKEERYVWRDVKDGETVSSLRVPSLVEMDGEVFAVAEAQCTEAGKNGFTGIASELLVSADQESLKGELDTTAVKTQVLEECPSDNANRACRIADQAVSQGVKRVHVSRPTTVVKGSDIYMLAGNYSWTLNAADQAADWGLMLVKGNVSKKDGEKNRIYWSDNYVIPWSHKDNQKEPLKRLVGSGGSGVKMEDGTLVFPLEGTKKGKKEKKDAEEDGKTVSLIIRSSDAAGWTLSKGMSADGCSDPSVVEWKDKKLMMMTACDDGRRRVYESGDKGDSWTEALGTLSRVWGSKKVGSEKAVRSGFITAKIEDRDVMLVTLPVYANKGEKEGEKGRLHLWLTDNTHIVDIGPVSVEGDDEVAASSLLYKSGDNNELIALYEKKKGEGEKPSGMVSVRLTAQLEKVKEVLKTWKKVDEIVSKLCTTSLALKDPSADNACSADKITDGLVGFLSGSFSGDTWRDEYLGVNATVNKGTELTEATGAAKAEDGVTFHGAWAEWPVGSQGQNQLYHFANYNFTLVATVSIDGVPEGDNTIPVMGVQMKGAGNSVFLGLSYDSEKKWQLRCGERTNEELRSIGRPETKRHVVLLLRNGNHGTAYVDGQRVGNEECELGDTESKGISHFYIGGDGGSAENTESREGAPVTVKNVLLYNRPLSSEVIGVLNPNKVTIQLLKDKSSEPSPVSSDSVNPNTSPATADAQQTGTLSTPDGKHLTEQGQSMGTSGAGSGGASTTAVSTITTPSAGEESVVQSASGTSSDGHKNVGGGSTADGDPTVETREGGTNGQEEEVNTQIREVNATALSSSLGNVSQENNSDAGTMRGSGLLPSLLLLLGLWWFAAL